MIETAHVENIINEGSKEETLNTIFMPPAPRQIIKFFDFMQAHITLVSDGMGVGLRETREGISKLLNESGYDYEVYQPFIEEFENKLLNQHYDAQEKNKNS